MGAVKTVSAAVGVGVVRKRSNFNHFQRELGAYLRDSGVDWRKDTGLSSFGAVAGAVWRSMDAEVKKNTQGISSIVDIAYNDEFREGGISGTRLADLERINTLYGYFYWWEWKSNIQGLLMREEAFINGDSVNFNGSGVLDSYTGITEVRPDGGVEKIYAQMKRLFSDSNHRKSYSGVAIQLNISDSELLSDNKRLVLVFELVPDSEAYDALTGKLVAGANTVMIDEITGKDVSTEESEVTEVPEVKEKRGKKNKAKAEAEENEIDKLRIEQEKQLKDIEILSKEIESREKIKKAAISSAEAVKLAKIKSGERVKLAKIKEYKSLLKEKVISFAQYQKLMKDL